MKQQERAELTALARQYADGLERLSGEGVRGVDNSTNLIVSIELLRQLATVLEEATCLDEKEKSS